MIEPPRPSAEQIRVCTSVIFAGPRRIELQTSPLPHPADDELHIRARCSAISAGTELMIFRGQMPRDMAADEDLPALAHSMAYPMKYGYAIAGRVVAVGRDVDRAWLGRRVFAFHPHESDFVSLPHRLVALPDDLTDEMAVLLPNMETAVNLVHDGRPLIGERVVVFGQGIVGLLTTTLLSRFPLQRLVTVDPLPARRAASLSCGALESVAPDDLSGDFDLVYEVSGNPYVLSQAIAATTFSGRVVIGSWYGDKRASVDLGGAFHRSRISIVSSQVSTIDPSLRGAWTKARRLDLALRLLREVRPTALVTHRFHLHEAPHAYALLDERPQEAVQVILHYEERSSR